MPKISSKELDGDYLIKQAKKSGLIVEPGRGDHVKVVAPNGRGYMIIPSRNIGKGLACNIVKWLIAAGVSLSVILTIYESIGG